MIKVYDYENYKIYIRERIKEMEMNGRGQSKRISEHLRIHPSRLSQIIRGSMNLTLEQGCALGKFFGLNDPQLNYFLELLQLERAGTEALKELIKQRLERLKSDSDELVNRLPAGSELSEESKAIFYSSWQYSAVRLLTSVKGFEGIDALSLKLGLSKARVRKILDFLLSTGLCVETKQGFAMGPPNTHLSSNSQLIGRHLSNWRLKAIQQHENLSKEELAYSGPMSISNQDAAQIRERLAEMIDFATRTAIRSKAEKLMCLNVDWIEI